MQYVILTASGWNGCWSPNSKYWRELFLPPPSSSVGCQTEEVNELIYPRFNIPLLIELFRWMPRHFKSGRICDLWASLFAHFHGCNTLLFSANWQPGVLECYWVNWQWAESHSPKQNRHSDTECTFQNRITGCSIVFQRNKYANLACFLNISK